MKSSGPSDPPSPLFPRLPGGRGALSRDRAFAHRRGRLEGAMVAAVAEHGYAKTTVAELVALAGISKRDFYEIFSGKDECFLATFEEIIERATTEVRGAYRAGSGFRGRLLAALETYAKLLVEQPAAASLAIVDSLSLGTAAVAPREAAEARFTELLGQSLAQGAEHSEISEVAMRGIVGGARRVVYECLREGRPERFGEQAEVLLDWALGYRRPGDAHLLEESFFVKAAAAPGSVAATEGEAAPGWEEPTGSARTRATLPARERIVWAVARLAAAGGYVSLSMPAISTAAGVSNRTFYREFKNKQEAFLAAFDELAAQALRQAVPAFQGEREWPKAVGAALAATLAFIAANPLFARLAFFELAAAGPVGLDHAERATRLFTAALSPAALPDGVEPLPEVVVEAIGGGIWTVIQAEISGGRTESLPALAPKLTDFALVPFGVS